MAGTATVRINLVRDLEEKTLEVLRKSGYNTDRVEKGAESAILAWKKAARYGIEVKSRNVLKAKGFLAKGEDEGLKILEEKITEGRNINPHLTFRTTDLAKEDNLVDHWDIKHLHLGKRIEGTTSRIERTKNVLMCRIDDQNVYFIAVASHGRAENEPWYEQHLMETIHKNWPESIQTSRTEGDPFSINPKWDRKEDIKALRQAGLATMIEMKDGTGYVPPGQIKKFHDGVETRRIIHMTERVESRVRDEWTRIKENARFLGYHLKESASVKLRDMMIYPMLIGISHWDMVEEETGYRFRETL